MAHSLTEHWQVGRTAERPVRIFANLNYGSYGDFVSSLFFLNSVVDRFDHKLVTVLYRNDRDFKAPMVSLLSDALALEIPEGRSQPSIDLVDSTSPAFTPQVLADPGLVQWYEANLNAQDIFITNAMAAAGHLWTFDRLCHLRFPDAIAATCAEELVKRGADPNRWFCALHAREPGYLDKPNAVNFRDTDPNVYWVAANYIVRTLGGQVVRLGHPTMTPYPPLDGVVDLSRDIANSLLQTFAISRARFFLGGPSGPSSVADAFNVPSGVADTVDYYPHNDGIVMRTIDLKTPDGRIYRQKELFDAGYSKLRIMDLFNSRTGYEIIKCPAGEVMRLAKFMYDMTADTPGWRIPAAAQQGPRPNQFTWPPGPPLPRGGFLPMA